MRMQKIIAASATTTLFLVAVNSMLQDAHAHSTVAGGEATVQNVDSYQVAFQTHPKFAAAGQNATLHFTVLDKNNSNVNGVHAAVVMKEKESGRIVEQMPYRFYEFGEISIPYRFHGDKGYVATLLARVNGDAKHMAAPLQADFDIAVGRTMSPNELVPMITLFVAGLMAGFVFLFRKRTQ